jgi:RNA polymerase sigma factor (sigma-70 family)
MQEQENTIALPAHEVNELPSVVEERYRSDRPRLLDFIRRRVRTAEDAEDILQDVFQQLAVTASIVEPIEHATAWLFTVARNKIIDWYRKRKTAPLPSSFDDDTLPMDLEEFLFDPAQDPDELYFRSLVWTELTDALENLPAEQREVFVMHELEGVSFREIAQRTGVPVNTLLSRKRYAVLFLRDRLRELYDDYSLTD